MREKCALFVCFLVDCFRLAVRKVPVIPRLLCGRRQFVSGTLGNDEIRRLLSAGRPVLIGRLGFTESVLAGTVAAMTKIGMGRILFDRMKFKIYENDEFWPVDDRLVLRLGEVFLESLRELDLYVCWNTFLERYFARYLIRPGTVCADFYALEPFCYEKPWSSALAGRKVLVICPFPETVQRQYAKRTRLWNNESVLPEFELHVLKSVYGRQSAPGCDTWFEALDALYEKAMAIDFDVAILACGPFAIPLGARFKRAGRSVITMCGVTQILFGIKGRRWDERDYVAKFYNEAWSRPDEQELPDFVKKVEQGCYL